MTKRVYMETLGCAKNRVDSENEHRVSYQG